MPCLPASNGLIPSLGEGLYSFLKFSNSGYLAFDYFVYKFWIGQLDSSECKFWPLTVAGLSPFLSLTFFCLKMEIKPAVP